MGLTGTLLGIAAIVVLAWWLATGVILHLGGLSRQAQGQSLVLASAALALALIALATTRERTDLLGAGIAFVAALVVWAWGEMAFLLGRISGPRRSGCAAEAPTRQRFAWAFQALAYHELSLCVLGAAVLAATWGGSQPTGWWVFAAMYAMRVSTKLHLFLGVRNRYETFLPVGLQYLASYFGRASRNAALWPTVALLAGLAAWAWTAAAVGGPLSPALAFLASMLSLGLVEHLLLALPLQGERLWQWGLRSRSLRRR